ncbi:hypothetical protein SAMN02745857_03173 [Andreprevotia lacus DSM 23236]|jgi:hypothetical protein|uniref:5-bromo-4-chloroindolyl phosphate hydrolysis protein n=1 Tax=Andreprevotia lacus DSM 23236 TaxID=1121001 RepID=A0A1W1XXK7_9NEIS|nr:hypothetical protein [Andreprevotia lacus]SMC28238.1 hypothetical protein SAMN02745857_03173 [Andreprevotia lacus DSM 23236]
MPLSTRLALFFYGTGNIVGCLCALSVLGLYLFGVIDAWWFAMTVAAYAFGWLVSPRSAQLASELPPQMPLLDMLDALIDSARRVLPAEAQQQLTGIRARVVELLPRLESASLPLPARMELDNVVRRDLAGTIANYAALPASFAALHPIRDGKTAKQLLQEQLVLLDREVAEIGEDIFSEDASKLAAHGDYLRSKFQPVNFLNHGQ